jgi:hypothetical protein
MFRAVIIPWDMALCSLIEFMLQRTEMPSFARNFEAADSKAAWRCRKHTRPHTLLRGAITKTNCFKDIKNSKLFFFPKV